VLGEHPRAGLGIPLAPLRPFGARGVKPGTDRPKTRRRVVYSGRRKPSTLVFKGKVTGDEMQLRVDTKDGAWGTDLVAKRSASK
jgi:hypothetical protein